MNEIAVLLATHNGARFIQEQLSSLSNNVTRFTVHWLDDQSTDGTRDVVLAVAGSLRMRIQEWHCNQRLHVPGAFFWLLENVRSDIYLFCDHDDIWQPGKIDATVSALSTGSEPPTFCFSEPFLFESDAPGQKRRYFEAIGVSAFRAQRPSRAFVLNPAVGNTVGISRGLRDQLLMHLPVARSHAIMHDWWLYLLALMYGRVRFLAEVPTSLYRQHSGNFFGVRRRKWSLSVVERWRTEQRYRRAISLQAKGFLQIATTLRRTPVLDAMMSSARDLMEADRRRSLGEIVRLARGGELPLPCKRALWFSVVSFISDARTADGVVDGSLGRLPE